MSFVPRTLATPKIIRSRQSYEKSIKCIKGVLSKNIGNTESRQSLDRLQKASRTLSGFFQWSLVMPKVISHWQGHEKWIVCLSKRRVKIKIMDFSSKSVKIRPAVLTYRAHLQARWKRYIFEWVGIVTRMIYRKYSRPNKRMQPTHLRGACFVLE